MDTEHQADENDTHSSASILLQGVIVLLVFYFGVFGIIAVDELYLHFGLLRLLPGGSEEIVHIIYYPLIMLVRFILGIR